MVKPGKKKDKQQNDDKQTKISSFFGNQSNKKVESKLFTKISTVPLQGAGRLTLTKKKVPVNNTKCTLPVRRTDQIPGQSIKKKQDTGMQNTDDDDVVFIDEEKSQLCTDGNLSNTNKVALCEDDESDGGGLLECQSGSYNNYKDKEVIENSKISKDKHDKKNNSGLPCQEYMINICNGQEDAQNNDPDNSFIVDNDVDSCTHTIQSNECGTNESAETSKASFLTPTKQDIKNNLSDSLESSPDIICETPNVNGAFKDATVRNRRKAISSRSFLCPSTLLGVQPGLKPARLKINQQKGTRKLIGKISVSFSSNSLSLSDSSNMGESSVTEINTDTVNVACDSKPDIYVDSSAASDDGNQLQGSLNLAKTFQEKNLKGDKPLSDVTDDKDRYKMKQSDLCYIPETHYDDVTDFKAADDLEEDISIDNLITSEEKGFQRLKLIHPVSMHCENHWSPKHNVGRGQHINDTEDTTLHESTLEQHIKIHTESHTDSLVQKFGATKTDYFENNVKNIFASKTSHFQRTKSCSDFSKSHSADLIKSTSKLINALEGADSRAAMTEENLWMEQRLLKHFTDDGFSFAYNGNREEAELKDPATTPVKMYGKSKHFVKRQAKSGLSPCAKRQPKNSFTDLKDKMQAHDDPIDKELDLAHSVNSVKKILCLESLVSGTNEIQQSKNRLTEQRAYKFGLKKKGILVNSDMKVTLENDRLLSELLGQLKSPSKAEMKLTSSQALKELNPPPKCSVVTAGENGTLSKDRKENVAFSKNMVIQKSRNKNSMVQSDIEMLDKLFGNDTSDSEEMEGIEKQDCHKNRDTHHTCLNASIRYNDVSVLEEPIIILDDTQNVENSECIIIEDNSDNYCDSVYTSKMIKSHDILNADRDHGQIAVDSVTKEICNKETLHENHCPRESGPYNPVLENMNSNCLGQEMSEHSTNILCPEVTSVAYSPSNELATSSSNEHHCKSSKQYPQMTRSSVSVQNTISSENSAETSGQSLENNVCFILNAGTGKHDKEQQNAETLPVRNSFDNGGINASSGSSGEDCISRNSSSYVNVKNNTENNTAISASICSSATVADLKEDTELSASMCDMLCESFDEDFQDFDELEMSNQDFRFTHLWNRFTVLDVVKDRTKNEIHLRLLCEKTKRVFQCILRGFWADTVIGKEDVVNIVGEFTDDVCIIDNKNGLLIVNPDLLLSGTLVVSSTFCARKSVLNEKFKGVDSGNLHMLYGSVIHSLFQTVLKDGVRNERGIMLAAKLLLRSNKLLHEMYSHNVQEASVMEEIGHYIPSLASWLTKHTQVPGKGALVRFQESDVVVKEIHDIEENIWSPRFGLKGKIDVTVKAKLRKSNSCEEVKILPLELKTGKASFSHEHKGQVTLYSMMSSDRREDPGEGILLYLKHGEMETVPVKPQNKSGLIQLRNNLVHYLSQEVFQNMSADGQVTYHLGQLPQPINNERACSKCAQLLNCSIYQRMVDLPGNTDHAMNKLVPESLQHLTEADLNYFTHWMLCLDLEGQESRRMHLSQIWCATSSEREKNGDCLSNLVIASSELDIPESQCFNEGRGCSLTFTRDPSHQGAALSAVGVVINDMVVISSEDGRYIALATGFVRRITHNLVEVVVDRDYLHDTRAYANIKFRLDKNDSFSTSGYLFTNLSRLMESTPRATYLRDLIIRLRPPECNLHLPKSHIQKIKAVFKPLNKPQRTALMKVLMLKDYVLIKGFPGTGKTATVVALVKILRLLGQSVLLTSYTHSAVDNILLKLKKDGVPFLRLGRIGRIHPEILSHSAEVLTSSAAMSSVQDLKNFYDSYDVVATSALGVNHPIFNQRKFDVCIVDEASQILQPACLGPLFHCHKFVLVGDPKQLPPVVQSRVARNLGMDESLFARLDNRGATYDLCLQYRMNRGIMKLSNTLVYEGKLQCGNLAVAEQCLTLNQSQILGPPWLKDALKSDVRSSVVFLDTQMILSEETSNGKGVMNETEAHLVMSIVKALVKADIAACDVGVISPYRSQVKLMKHKLHEFPDVRNIEVNTVDQYQGRDKNIIIVSFVRSQSDHTGELLKDLRRLNVALTRAKHKLILIGNAKALKANDHIANILMLLEETKNIIQVTEL